MNVAVAVLTDIDDMLVECRLDVEYNAEALDTNRRDDLHSSNRDRDVVSQRLNSTMSSKNGNLRLVLI